MENSIVHTYNVGGMSCGGCATRVQNKLLGAAGVTSVKVDLTKKEARITSNEIIEIDTLQSVLNNTGFSIEPIRNI